MRILVLTLMMGFLSHSAFGAEEGVSTISSTPYADAQAARELEKQEGILTDEDILAQRFP